MTSIQQFVAPPTIGRFIMDDNPLVAIMGPVGSGKSSGAFMKLLRHGREQRKGPNGRRRTRWAVSRSTYRALNDTTVKTIFDWLPPNASDRMWTPSDMRYNFAIGDADYEILFRSLDTPDDIKKLLSLELTGFWVNEAREIDLSIVHVLRGRCGRYPSAREEGCTWHGGFMDTNPPDDDHWWFKVFEDERPEGWSLHKQPAGDGPDAENVENLVDGYYDNLKSGADGEFIKVYIRGEYGFVRSGQPVYPHYKDSTHCAAEPFGPVKGVVIEVGVDSSGLTPAAIFGQKLPNGRTVRFDEMIGDGMGAQRFLEAVRERLRMDYQKWDAKLWGDPAGMARSPTDEKTWYSIAQELGLTMQPARTNLIVPRIESVSALHRMMADGMPAYMISPKCRILRKGLNGGYSYRRMQIGGEQRFMSTPDKNRFSHPCDADQYLTIEMTGGVSIVTAEDEPKKRRDSYRSRERGADQTWMAS